LYFQHRMKKDSQNPVSAKALCKRGEKTRKVAGPSLQYFLYFQHRMKKDSRNPVSPKALCKRGEKQEKW